ncbi:hypothetical protein [Propioniciclava soli]|uniref:hypothetical protein n=1 Tax=Propioniciclava soli TaxID=2775081 RepID=UPI001E5F3D9D|nr:hypothetical protein [Propioniciclava soli]
MRALRTLLITVILLGLAAVAAGIAVVLWYSYQRQPLPLSDQCIALVADADVALTTEQAHNASIIAGVSTRHALEPRAATIALATAYQESGLRNLDHGDRDSLGLFQQRPSQGWGTPEQVQDPYWASDRFYDALVTIPGWETGDVNDVAQAVQRSGFPEAYRQHVENARRIASSLTGQTPASFSCRVANPPAGDPAGLAAFLERTLPADVVVRDAGDRVVVEAPTNRAAWSAAQIAVAQRANHGLTRVELGGRTWTADPRGFAWWAGEGAGGTTVTVHFDDLGSPTPTPGG